MIVLNNTKYKICVVEITGGFETNIAKNCKRKVIRYKTSAAPWMKIWN